MKNVKFCSIISVDIWRLRGLPNTSIKLPTSTASVSSKTTFFSTAHEQAISPKGICG